MADAVKVKTAGLHRAILAMISAHTAVREGIATHAQKHEATLDDRRRSAKVNSAIKQGIATHTQHL